jgi:acyl dehydratase
VTDTIKTDLTPIDTSEIERWVGKPIGAWQLKEPIAANDIRRWVQAMQNPNPLYYDEDVAAESRIGHMAAPQSFLLACTYRAASDGGSIGIIPDSGALHAADEFWFEGPRVLPGDHIRTEHSVFDYRMVSSRFAGPTVLQRSDVTYVNQRSEVIARQRGTSFRYLKENAKKLESKKGQEVAPDWTAAQLAEIQAEKERYYSTFQGRVLRTISDVAIGQELPVGIVGPHTTQTLVLENAAIISRTWGTTADEVTPEVKAVTQGISDAGARYGLDPRVYNAGTLGWHIDPRLAQGGGVPRAFGYGASMCAWALDWVDNWSGELGFMVHADVRYISQAFVGDLARLNGSVESVDPDNGTCQVSMVMENQAGTLMARGTMDVRFS